MIDYFTNRRSQEVLWLVSLVFFILIALDVFFDGALTQFDRVVYHWSLGWHHPLLDRIVFGVTQLGSLRAVLFYSVAVLLFLFWKKASKAIYFLILSVLGSATLFSQIKEFVGRSRPSNHIDTFLQQGYAFPSGHATMSMTFSLAVFFLFYPKATGLYRSALLLFCLIFPLMISSSRLYLGVHYLSDVLGGIWLGFFWVVLMAWRFEISQATKP